MLRYLFDRDLFALFVDPRVRKTLPVVRRLRAEGDRLRRILIAAPYSALYGWGRALDGEGVADYIILEGEAKKRRQKLERGAKWVLANKEIWKTVPDIANIRWDAVICDESTYLKNPKSATSQFWVDNFRSSRIRGIMTGTPAPESELEYFQQFAFLDKNILGYKSYYDFRDDWFICPEQSFQWYLKYRGRAFLERKLARHCFVLKRADIRGEDKTYTVRTLRMPAEIRRIYRKAEDDFILSIPGQDDIKTIWAMTRFGWLRRLASGVMDEEVLWPGKIDAVHEYLTGEARRIPAIIWAAYTEEQNRLLEIFGDSARIINGSVTPKKREAIRVDFQAGRFNYIIGQPSCFRHGTDLRRAELMVYFSRPLGLETNQQSEDRFIDMDQNWSKDVVDFVTENTVDWSVYRGIKLKEKRSLVMLRIYQEARGRQ